MMRIRNSQSSFSELIPETTPRAAQLPSQQGSKCDGSLVEEENGRIEWSCYAIKDFPAQISRENPLHDEIETASTSEIRPLNCVAKEKEASEGQSRGEADKSKELSSCGSPPRGKESKTSAAVIAIPYSSPQGAKLPFKKRKPYIYTETEVEMERAEVEGVMLDAKVEDAIMEAKQKCILLDVEAEDHLTEDREEDEPVQLVAEYATPEMEQEDILFKVEVEDVEIEEEDAIPEVEEDERTEVQEECGTEEVEDAKVEVKDDTWLVEVKMDTTKMNELEHFNEKEVFQKTQTINCTVTYRPYVPSPTVDENKQGHEKQENIEETEFDPNEKPRGRKRKRSDNSASSDKPPRKKLNRGRPKRMQDHSDEENQGQRKKLNRGRPKRMQDHSVEGNQGRTEKWKPRRGRPKRGMEETFDPNWEAEILKPKRGRPKMVKDEMPKPKRGRPKMVKDEMAKPKRGRPKIVKDEMPKPKRGGPKKVKDEPGTQFM